MAAVSPALLLVATSAGAQAAHKERSVLFQEAVPIPVDAANTTGGLYSFDISWVDQMTQTYYLADRSNFAIDVVDAKTDTFITQVSATPPFAGASPGGAELSGPNGVLTANGCIIATDAGNRVVSFTAGGAQVADIHITSDPGRADELAFDPKDNLLLVITPVPSGSLQPAFAVWHLDNGGCRLHAYRRHEHPVSVCHQRRRAAGVGSGDTAVLCFDPQHHTRDPRRAAEDQSADRDHRSDICRLRLRAGRARPQPYQQHAAVGL